MDWESANRGFTANRRRKLCAKWLAWRYQLIPYLQGCALEANQTGMPVMRSMVLAFPEDRIAWQFEQQYMLGGSLLVVPVVVPGGKVRFYLPAGKWYDIWNQTWVEGARLFEQDVPLDHIPVSGARVPSFRWDWQCNTPVSSRQGCTWKRSGRLVNRNLAYNYQD